MTGWRYPFSTSPTPDEMARLADHLVLMEEGRALASGSLTETLARLDLPLRHDQEVGVVVEAVMAEHDPQWHLARMEFPGGSLRVRDMGAKLGRRVRVLVLARDISLARQRGEETSIRNPAVVTKLAPGEHPAEVLVRLQVGETPLVARLTARSADALGLAEGWPVWAQLKSVTVIE
ncbi:TOBE domain-containing protein [Thiohalomonas denitrificans]|uniref:TOBE domain-containing protein n=1 Tax=Thiohalomonas denitrificans TaxID=415747 RepID=UPI003983BD08